MKLTNFEEWYSETLQKALDEEESIVKEIKQTSVAFPEQYNLFDKNNDQIGYIRMRHGIFELYAPSLWDELLISENAGGNSTSGRFGIGNFKDEKERIEIFKKCIKRLNYFYENEFYGNEGE